MPTNFGELGWFQPDVWVETDYAMVMTGKMAPISLDGGESQPIVGKLGAGPNRPLPFTEAPKGGGVPGKYLICFKSLNYKTNCVLFSHFSLCGSTNYTHQWDL